MSKKLLFISTVCLLSIMTTEGFAQCSKPCGNPSVGNNKTSCCPGDPVNIGVNSCEGTNQCASGCSGFTYSWAPSGGNQCTATVNPTTTTTYTLYITYPSCCCCDGATGNCSTGTCGTGTRQASVTVTVTGGCCSVINPGDHKIKNESGIKIFPNPASTILNLYIPNLSPETGTMFVIYDINGKMVSNIDVTENSKEIDISLLAKGINYVRVFQGDKEIMFDKLIIQ
jgi:hypothetical protein